MTPEQVVGAYFDAIRARDAEAIGALFTPDAELVTVAGTFVGRDAIVDFYATGAFTIDDLEPHPGPPMVDGDQVVVDIVLRMAGTDNDVSDTFTLVGDAISRLVITMGAPRPA